MMNKLTLKLGTQYFKYADVTRMNFFDDVQENPWDDECPAIERYFVNIYLRERREPVMVIFAGKKEWEYAQQHLEEALMMDYVFIDLNIQENTNEEN